MTRVLKPPKDVARGTGEMSKPLRSDICGTYMRVCLRPRAVGKVSSGGHQKG